MASKLDKYPNLKKAQKARMKKAKERALKKARHEKELKKKSKKKVVVESSSSESDVGENKEELDVAAYLSELCNQQLKMHYKDVIKPKIKKQLKKYENKKQLNNSADSVNIEHVVNPTVVEPVEVKDDNLKRKNLFD